MSLLTLAINKERYLQTAWASLQAEAKSRPAQEVLVQSDCERMIKECLDMLDLLEQADIQHHSRAATEPNYDFATHDAQLEEAFTKALRLCRSVLAFAQQLSDLGFPPEGREALVERTHEWERILNWSDDYVKTPTFQALLNEAMEDYKAGRVEEGGWEP